MVDFSNSYEVERWFESQPREVCIAIAVRSAFRVFPAVRSYLVDGTYRPDDDALILFLALAPLLVAGTWPKRLEELSRIDAVDAIDDTARAVNNIARAAQVADAGHVAAATRAAYAAEAIHAATLNASSPAVVHAGATIMAAAAVTAANAKACAADAAVIENGASCAFLCRRPLWPDGIPEQLWDDWIVTKDVLLDCDPNWSVWMDWYEDRLYGARDPRSRPLIEQLEVERAFVRNSKWDRWVEGPSYINALIAEIEAKYRGQPTEIQVPEPRDSSVRAYLGDDGRLHRAVLPPPETRDREHKSELEEVWEAQLAHVSDLLAREVGKNAPDLQRALTAYRDALGDNFENLKVLSLGLAGIRVGHQSEIADSEDSPLLRGTVGEIRALAASHDLFIAQFPKWLHWRRNANAPVSPEALLLTVEISRDIGARPNVADAEVREDFIEITGTIDAAVRAGTGPEPEVANDARFSATNIGIWILKALGAGVRKGAEETIKEAARSGAKETLKWLATGLVPRLMGLYPEEFRGVLTLLTDIRKSFSEDEAGRNNTDEKH